jgi:hypothetical protein
VKYVEILREKQLGRPRKKCNDGILMDLEEIFCEDMELLRLLFNGG